MQQLMRRLARLSLGLVVTVTACSSSSSGGGAPGASGGSASIPSSGGASAPATGGAVGTGGQSTLPASTGGATGTGGRSAPATTGGAGVDPASGGASVATGGTTTPAGGTGGRSAAPDGGAIPSADAGGGGAQSYVCSTVLGLMLTSQWYTAGFEQAPGIDNARWQLKWMEHAYIDEWANPNSSFWGITAMSPCAMNSTSSDRVVLVALSWTIVTLADWESNVTKDVENIKVKFPNVKQIVLMTIVRGPGNKSCGNTTVVAENTLIPTYVDQALANVAAKYPGLVVVGPKAEGASCAEFQGTGPHLTTAGNMGVAKMIASFFANQ